MLGSSKFTNYVDEPADLSRNPFKHTSRIDCDKFFVSASVQYDDNLKTSPRPDVCQDLYNSVKSKLLADGYRIITLNENALVQLNALIKF